MAIVFPASPSVNDTFTAGSITYKWDGAKWIGLGVTPTDKLIEGSNKLEIDGSNQLVWNGGNVGIGTANPDYSLTIGDGSSYVIQNLKAKNDEFCEFRFGDPEGIAQGKITYDHATDSLRFTTNGDGEKVRITSDGSFGIGEDSPADRLVVQKTNASGDVGVRIKNDTLTDGDATNPTTASLYLNTSTGDFNTFYIQARRNDGATHFGYSNPRDANHTPNLVITSGGQVGIGTDSPGRQLSVYNASNSGVEIKSNTDGQSSVFFTDTADSNIGMIGYMHNDDSMFFRVNDLTRVNITSDGYVTKPNTPYFSVQGSPSISNFTNYTNSVYNFATINSNNGSHYNNSTGRFTAPVAGFYWFSCGLWSSTSDNSGGTYLLNLTRDNIGGGTATELQFAGANHAVEKNQLSVSAGIYMTVGQTVRMWYNGSIQGSTPRNYFSGYLVG
jgi:hypothetical protein